MQVINESTVMQLLVVARTEGGHCSLKENVANMTDNKVANDFFRSQGREFTHRGTNKNRRWKKHSGTQSKRGDFHARADSRFRGRPSLATKSSWELAEVKRVFNEASHKAMNAV